VGIVIRQLCEGQCREGDVSNGCKRQGPWPEGWDPAAYIGGPEGLSRTRGLGVGGEGVGGWGRAGKKKMGSTANTGSQLKKNMGYRVGAEGGGTLEGSGS